MPSKIDIDEDFVASAYKQGSTIRVLAEGNGVSYGTMHRILSARDDVVMRKTGGHPRARDDTNPAHQRPGPPPRPPGRIIRAHLSKIGITQGIAAKRMQVGPDVLTLLIQGKRVITPAMARKLEAAVRLDALALLIEQARWQLHQLDTRTAAAPRRT